MFFNSAYADTTTTGQSGLTSLVLPLSLLFVFYFLLIRPQQKQRKQHQALMASLKKGDKVMTSSGLMATIAKILSEQEVILEISDGVKCKFLKSAIVNVISNQVNTNADNNSKTITDKQQINQSEAKEQNNLKTNEQSDSNKSESAEQAENNVKE